MRITAPWTRSRYTTARLPPAEIATLYDQQRCGYYYCNGSFRIGVIDAGASVEWKNISWTGAYKYGESVEPDYTSTAGLYRFSGSDGVELPAETGTTGMKGLWHLNDNSTADSSGNGNNGVMQGGLDCTGDEGVFDDGCYLDGADDYVNISSVNPTTDYITVAIWVKAANSSGYYGSYYQIVSKYSAYILGGNTTNGKNMNFIIYNSSSWFDYTNGYYIDDPSKWHHFVGTFNSSTHELKFYSDGILRSTKTVYGTIATDTGPLHIGHREADVPGTNHFNGSIDEVVIYNRSLSDSEVLAMYQRGRANDSSATPAKNNSCQLVGPVQTGGKVGTALSFDGSNDYVDCGNDTSLNMAGDFSMDAWIYLNSSGIITHRIMSKGDYNDNCKLNYFFQIAGTNLTGGGFFNDCTTYVSLYGKTYLKLNRWYHVAATWDNTTKIFKIYVNGALDNSSTFPGKSPTTNPYSMMIGRLGSSAAFYGFNGSIDEPAIYNRTLSASEIYDRYMRGLVMKFRIKTCQLSDCADQGTVLGPDLTVSTYFTNSSGNPLINFTNATRYFQWRVNLENLEDSGTTPYLQDVAVNYTGILTDASGNYNYSFTAPAAEGTYPVVVNTTFMGLYGNNSKDLLVSNYIVSGGHGTTCDATHKCMFIYDSTSTARARFDATGNVDVIGGFLYSQASVAPSAKSFVIRDSAGNAVFYINTTGHIVTKGTYIRQSSIVPTGNNDFIIKNSSGSAIGYIDGGTGSMYFRGVLHYNSDFT